MNPPIKLGDTLELSRFPKRAQEKIRRFEDGEIVTLGPFKDGNYLPGVIMRETPDSEPTVTILGWK